MSEPTSYRLSGDVRAKLKSTLRDAVATLRTHRPKLSLRERLAYTLHVSGPSPAEIFSMPIIQTLQKHETFRRLFELAVNEPSIWSVLLDSLDPTVINEDRNDPVFSRYIEMTLLRICAALDLKVAYTEGTELKDNLDAQLEDLLSFLALASVERRVVVPLLNIDLSSDEITIAGFGQLSKVRHVHAAPIAFQSSSHVDLSFTATTAHFMGVTQSPVWQEIRKRVTLIRLATHPLVSYNHFSIQFFEPWEQPIPDSEFSVRFWGWRSEKLKVPCLTLDDKHAADTELMCKRLENFQWKQLSPWRLASERLDDAVFKLECRSPDAILDIAIGLESVLTEEQSRQESTHKVAVRAARYLEQTNEARRELFRVVKGVYKLRSTLAHGQTWELDVKGMDEIRKAAQVLARTLRNMALNQQSELNLTELDLS